MLRASYWQSFASYHFVLPQIELYRGPAGVCLACNVLRRKEQSFEEVQHNLLDFIKDLSFKDGRIEDFLFAPIAREDQPNSEKWDKNLTAFLNAIGTSQLHKVVLARKTQFPFEEPLEGFSLLQKLKQTTPECFHFCFAFDRDQAFIGATPERLYHRHGRYIRSEALAGTRPRGKEQDDDVKLSIELLQSSKDMREHRFVVDAIREALEPLCRTLTVDRDISLMKLAKGQHLFSDIQGTLYADVSEASIVKALHPTPAVGGSPTAEALNFIRETESFDRGERLPIRSPQHMVIKTYAPIIFEMSNVFIEKIAHATKQKNRNRCALVYEYYQYIQSLPFQTLLRDPANKL